MIFEVQGQDGNTYEVDAPDAQTAAQASMQAYQQSPVQSYGKALGAGIVKGAAGLAGSVGDVSQLMQSGFDWLAKKTLSPEKYQKGLEYQKQQAGVLPLPTSADIQSSIEKNITGPLYQAQTPGEQRAETVGSFVPGMLGGGGSLVRRALTNVLAPASGMQAAKEATQGNPQLQPFAQIGGALVGGVLGKHLGNVLTPDKIPLGEQIKSAADALYKHPEVQSLRIDPQAASNLSDNIQKTLLNNKVDPIAAPRTYQFVEGLKTPRFGPETQVSDLDMARQSLSTVPFEEGRAAHLARSAIDDYLSNIPKSDVTAGNADNVSSIMQQARANWAAQAREAALQEAMQKATENAAVANSGRNMNAMRRSVLNMVRNEQGLTPEEVAQAQKVWGGTPTGNTARYVANLLGAGGGLGQIVGAAGTGFLLGGTPHSASIGALLGMLTGNVARHVGMASTKRNTELLSQMLRARSPLAQSMGATPSIVDPMQNALVNALISSQVSDSNK